MEMVFAVKEVPSWAQPLLDSLVSDKLLEEEITAKQIQCKAKAYTIINNELYKRSVCWIYQRCFSPEEGIELLREIHQGECGHHASSRAIVGKAFRHGFYWPTALADAEKLVHACVGC
jgi:hypothetical protein